MHLWSILCLQCYSLGPLILVTYFPKSTISDSEGGRGGGGVRSQAEPKVGGKFSGLKPYVSTLYSGLDDVVWSCQNVKRSKIPKCRWCSVSLSSIVQLICSVSRRSRIVFMRSKTHHKNESTMKRPEFWFRNPWNSCDWMEICAQPFSEVVGARD